MSRWRVVLDGDELVAVVPEGREVSPDGEVLVYDRGAGRWLGSRSVASLVAHAHGWEEPAGVVVVEIPNPR